MKAGILHVSFHAGEGEGAADLPDCCARAPHVKVNKTNKTMGASVLGPSLERGALVDQCAVRDSHHPLDRACAYT